MLVIEKITFFGGLFGDSLLGDLSNSVFQHGRMGSADRKLTDIVAQLSQKMGGIQHVGRTVEQRIDRVQ